jgi:hypothetical protein
VVHTINYRVLYVLFFISHDRRELIHFNVTSNPTAAWVWQQLIEATPWGRQPKYLIHDRDAVYGRTFGARLAKLGIASVRIPVRAPRANAIAERVVRSISAPRCVECAKSSQQPGPRSGEGPMRTTRAEARVPWGLYPAGYERPLGASDDYRQDHDHRGHREVQPTEPSRSGAPRCACDHIRTTRRASGSRSNTEVVQG